MSSFSPLALLFLTTFFTTFLTSFFGVACTKEIGASHSEKLPVSPEAWDSPEEETCEEVCVESGVP